MSCSVLHHVEICVKEESNLIQKLIKGFGFRPFAYRLTPLAYRWALRSGQSVFIITKRNDGNNNGNDNGNDDDGNGNNDDKRNDSGSWLNDGGLSDGGAGRNNYTKTKNKAKIPSQGLNRSTEPSRSTDKGLDFTHTEFNGKNSTDKATKINGESKSTEIDLNNTQTEFNGTNTTDKGTKITNKDSKSTETNLNNTHTEFNGTNTTDKATEIRNEDSNSPEPFKITEKHLNSTYTEFSKTVECNKGDMKLRGNFIYQESSVRTPEQIEEQTEHRNETTPEAETEHWTVFCCWKDANHFTDSVFNVALVVKDVDEVTRRVKSRGGIVLREPSEIMDNFGKVKYSIVTSCCGNIVHTLIDKRGYNGVFLPGYEIYQGNFNPPFENHGNLNPESQGNLNIAFENSENFNPPLENNNPADLMKKFENKIETNTSNVKPNSETNTSNVKPDFETKTLNAKPNSETNISNAKSSFETNINSKPNFETNFETSNHNSELSNMESDQVLPTNNLGKSFNTANKEIDPKLSTSKLGKSCKSMSNEAMDLNNEAIDLNSDKRDLKICTNNGNSHRFVNNEEMDSKLSINISQSFKSVSNEAMDLNNEAVDPNSEKNPQICTKYVDTSHRSVNNEEMDPKLCTNISQSFKSISNEATKPNNESNEEKDPKLSTKSLSKFKSVNNVKNEEFWPDSAPFSTFIDHVTYVCKEGTSKNIIAWYEYCLGMKRFKSNREDSEEEGYVLGGNIGIRLKALEYWRCAEVGLIGNSSDNTFSLKLVLAEALPGVAQSQINDFLQGHGQPGVQHIALHTPTMLDTVNYMKECGVKFRHPPPVYYQEDIKLEEIQEAGHGSEVARFKELGILLDTEADVFTEVQDEVEGKRYLMQVFTLPIFERDTFFLEVIQRCGARGFGAGNITALAKSVILYKQQLERGTS